MGISHVTTWSAGCDYRPNMIVAGASSQACGAAPPVMAEEFATRRAYVAELMDRGWVLRRTRRGELILCPRCAQVVKLWAEALPRANMPSQAPRLVAGNST